MSTKPIPEAVRAVMRRWAVAQDIADRAAAEKASALNDIDQLMAGETGVLVDVESGTVVVISEAHHPNRRKTGFEPIRFVRMWKVTHI